MNINGLRRHLDEISSFLNGKGIHVLALNEAKVDNSYPKQLTNILGYQQERKDRTARGGGVALYIREPILYTRRTDLPSQDLELICVEIQPPKSNVIAYIVIAWYRPPSDPVEFFNKLETILSYLDQEGKEIILLGDINCNFAKKTVDLSDDMNAMHLRRIYNLLGLTHLIEEPTRVTCETATLIDHIATTCPINIFKSGILKHALSDHYMVYCIRKLNGSISKNYKSIKTRNMKKFSEEAFLRDVASIDWEQALEFSGDANLLVQQFSSEFSQVIEKHAPLRQIRVSEKYCPWIHSDLKNLIRTRDRLKRSAVKHKSQHLMNSYKQYRNRTNALNKALKKQYFSDKINSSKGNMKDSWQTLNHLLNKRSPSTNIVSLKESNQTIFDKQSISNKMNEYFFSIGEKLAADIAHTSNPLLSNEISVNGGGRIFDFREINERDIHDAMFKIKVKKNFGNDNISGYFLKIAFPYVSRILMLVFNTSIETSTFVGS